MIGDFDRLTVNELSGDSGDYSIYSLTNKEVSYKVLKSK